MSPNRRTVLRGIGTTGLLVVGAATPAVADEIERVIAGEREPSAGEVSFLDYL